MKHYYHPMSRAVTTDWMLRELDVAHEQVLVDYPNEENKQEAFTKINPMQKVPTLVDGDTIVTESAAICAYLADKYIEKGLAPALDSPERGKYFRYMFFPGVTLEPMFTVQQLDTSSIAPESAGWGDLGRCLRAIEVMTPEHDWVFGDQFTAADVVYGGTIDFAVQFGWLGEPTDRVRAYVQRIKARPAYRASHDESWH